MSLLSWPTRVFNTIRLYYNNNRKVKYTINIFSALLFMFLGALLYALLLATLEIEFWAKLAILVSSTVGATSILLLVIERIFKIEVHARQLDYTGLQIENSTIDTASISHNVAVLIADLVSNELMNEDSVFEVRARHYKREKKVLAENFVKLMEKRVKHLLDKRVAKQLQIVIDSGSTLSPIFDVIGKEASIDAYHWTRNVNFYTNNIKGVQLLLKYRESSRGNIHSPRSTDEAYNDRHLEIPVTCSILPGKVLSAYSAIADESTIRAVQDIGNRHETYTICVTTGNYILFDKKSGVVVPIARTGFHPHMKAILYDIADELYLIAPLGKILKGDKDVSIQESLSQFNIDMKDNTGEHSGAEYVLPNRELLTQGKIVDKLKREKTSWDKKAILVTTERTTGHNFAPHFRMIKDTITDFSPTITTTSDEYPKGPYLWTCAFDELPKIYMDQNEVEIPHAKLRPFRKKYFWVEE